MRWSRRVIGWLGFCVLVALWNREALVVHTSRTCIAIMFLTLIPVPGAALLGRALLRRPRNREQLASITLGVHYTVMLLMGVAIVNAFKLAQLVRPWPFAFPHVVATTLVYLTGATVASAVLTLGLRGLG